MTVIHDRCFSVAVCSSNGHIEVFAVPRPSFRSLCGTCRKCHLILVKAPRKLLLPLPSLCKLRTDLLRPLAPHILFMWQLSLVPANKVMRYGQHGSPMAPCTGGVPSSLHLYRSLGTEHITSSSLGPIKPLKVLPFASGALADQACISVNRSRSSALDIAFCDFRCQISYQGVVPGMIRNMVVNFTVSSLS